MASSNTGTRLMILMAMAMAAMAITVINYFKKDCKYNLDHKLDYTIKVMLCSVKLRLKH